MEDQPMMGLPDTTWHYCPVGECTVKVPNVMLMCAKHWRLVPKPLARAVYHHWHDGRPDRRHREACRMATAAVDLILEERKAGG